MFFKKKIEKKTYDPNRKRPCIRVSICTGEQVAGFEDLETGKFDEVMLIRTGNDLDEFRKTYGITEDIKKIY